MVSFYVLYVLYLCETLLYEIKNEKIKMRCLFYVYICITGFMQASFSFGSICAHMKTLA